MKRKVSTLDKNQSKLFIDAARELECDESDDALERVFRKIDPQKRPTPTNGKDEKTPDD
ncbi:MAG: hypothetical protein RIE87_02270 [Rhodospirillales bacterium]